MRLFRFGDPGLEHSGAVLPDGKRIDCSGFGEDWNEQFFDTGGLSRLASWLEQRGQDAPVVADGTRLGPPICRSMVVKLLLGFLHRHSLGHPVRNMLRKHSEIPARFLKGMRLPAVTSVLGRAG